MFNDSLTNLEYKFKFNDYDAWGNISHWKLKYFFYKNVFQWKISVYLSNKPTVEYLIC